LFKRLKSLFCPLSFSPNELQFYSMIKNTQVYVFALKEINYRILTINSKTSKLYRATPSFSSVPDSKFTPKKKSDHDSSEFSTSITPQTTETSALGCVVRYTN